MAIYFAQKCEKKEYPLINDCFQILIYTMLNILVHVYCWKLYWTHVFVLIFSHLPLLLFRDILCILYLPVCFKSLWLTKISLSSLFFNWTANSNLVFGLKQFLSNSLLFKLNILCIGLLSWDCFFSEQFFLLQLSVCL